MCEIDNLCYHFGLAERTRARVEDAGRVELADDQAAAIARSKEVHIIVIVATVLLGVSMAGGAWAASENGDGYLRSPMSRMGPSFALPAIGLWAVAMFEATERGMDHRNTVLGLHTRVVSHTNRVAEIAMRIGWIFIVRIVTVPLVVMFFGVLNLSKDYIVSLYPLSAVYIDYLYEVVDIIKTIILQLLNQF